MEKLWFTTTPQITIVFHKCPYKGFPMWYSLGLSLVPNKYSYKVGNYKESVGTQLTASSLGKQCQLGMKSPHSLLALAAVLKLVNWQLQGEFRHAASSLGKQSEPGMKPSPLSPCTCRAWLAASSRPWATLLAPAVG